MLCPARASAARTPTAPVVGRRAADAVSACDYSPTAAPMTAGGARRAESSEVAHRENAMSTANARPRPAEKTQRGAVAPQGPSLPHERDQQNQATNPEPDPDIQRAARDLKQGQVDTDLRATPGLDAERRGDLVKGGERGASQPPKTRS